MATPNIQVLKPKYRVDECLAAIKECLESGWTGLGGKTVEFEEAWKNYTKLPHAHFLSSATAGLHLAVKILKDAGGWKEGDEIITTPLTFVSTNHAILYERLMPIFADIHPDTLCLDPNSVEQRITPRTRAVMFVGIGGSPGHLEYIREICKRRNLKLILDAAHMAGTKISRQQLVGDGTLTYTLWRDHVGGEADVSVFSFQTVKNLPTADGGMICFQDPEYDARVRKLSWLGIDKDTYSRSGQQGTYKWRYDVPDVGFKYHGNSIMAAIGLTQLKYLDEDNHQRACIYGAYTGLLGDERDIRIIDGASNFNCYEASHHLCQIVVPNRDKVLEIMNEYQIYPGVHYVDNTNYRMYRYAAGTCPNAHKLSDELLTLPIHLGMSNDDINRVAQAVKRALE